MTQFGNRQDKEDLKMNHLCSNLRGWNKMNYYFFIYLGIESTKALALWVLFSPYLAYLPPLY